MPDVSRVPAPDPADTLGIYLSWRAKEGLVLPVQVRAAVAELLAGRRQDKVRIERLTDALRTARPYVYGALGQARAENQPWRVSTAEESLAQVDAALADDEGATAPQNVTEGMPPELVRALRDPTIRLPQDDYRLADGRTLWEHLQEWRDAPSGTASAGGEDTTP